LFLVSSASLNRFIEAQFMPRSGAFPAEAPEYCRNFVLVLLEICMKTIFGLLEIQWRSAEKVQPK